MGTSMCVKTNIKSQARLRCKLRTWATMHKLYAAQPLSSEHMP